MAGDDDPGGAEGIRGPDERPDVAGAGGPIEHDGEHGRSGRDAAQADRVQGLACPAGQVSAGVVKQLSDLPAVFDGHGDRAHALHEELAATLPLAGYPRRVIHAPIVRRHRSRPPDTFRAALIGCTAHDAGLRSAQVPYRRGVIRAFRLDGGNENRYH